MTALIHLARPGRERAQPQSPDNLNEMQSLMLDVTPALFLLWYVKIFAVKKARWALLTSHLAPWLKGTLTQYGLRSCRLKDRL